MPAFVIERRQFRLQDHAFGWQLLDRIEQLWIIERLFIARNQAHIFAVLEGQRPVSIEFDFVEPVALWQLLDRKRLHRFNERETSSSAFCHSMVALFGPSAAYDLVHFQKSL